MAAPAVAAPQPHMCRRWAVAPLGDVAGVSIPTPAWGLTATAGHGDRAAYGGGLHASQPPHRAGVATT